MTARCPAFKDFEGEAATATLAIRESCPQTGQRVYQLDVIEVAHEHTGCVARRRAQKTVSTFTVDKPGMYT